MTYLAIAIALLIVAAIVAWDIWRSKQKRKAPRADKWIGAIGFQESGHWAMFPFSIPGLIEHIETYTGRKLTPVVLVIRPTPIALPGGGTAAGIYHSTKKGWDHAWIEIYTWEALPHELLHHATGL